jgi:hypothetical protein
MLEILPTPDMETKTLGLISASSIALARLLVVFILLARTVCWKPEFHLRLKSRMF